MAIIDLPSGNIEISKLSSNLAAELKLNYHGQRYDLVQAFASNKLELAQRRLEQKIAADPANRTDPNRYLLVREADYYSLWILNLILDSASMTGSSNCDLELQTASIWLFQELWLQWEDLLGAVQLQVLADNLVGVNPRLKSRTDLDRLLNLDPLNSAKLADWCQVDFIALDRQLYQLTQKKIGHQFGNKLTIDIIESMPDTLRSTLLDVLNLKTP
jgi:hypothetical protein